jgi:hypothetical protein
LLEGFAGVVGRHDDHDFRRAVLHS